MNELEERIKHLEKLLSQIEQGKGYERDFDKLYKLLTNEYRLEGGKDAPYHMGSYNHNLSQTIDKQASTYLHYKRKRPVKGAPSEYDDFIRNFKQDVDEELTRCKYRLNPPTSE